MISLAIFAVTFVLGLVAVIYFNSGRSSQNSRSRSVPGMTPTDPREGNFPDIAVAGGVHPFLVKLHKDYGPIASFWHGATYTVSIASPELFKEHMGLFDRPPELFEMMVPLAGKSNIQYANKADGKSRRHIYAKPFGHEILKYFYEDFNELADDLVQKLSSLPEGEQLPLVEHCYAIVIKAIMKTSFGDYFKEEANILKFRHTYETCWNDMEASLTEGLPVEGSDRDKEFKKALVFLHNTVREVLKQHRANPTVGRQVFIDVLIDSELPEDQVRDDCLAFMVGGFHTSGNLMAFALYFLAKHPECQDKLHQEIKEIVGSDKVDSSHIKRLTYLRQVLDESLRVSVIAPYAGRFDDNKSELGGYVIAPRTPVFHALGVVLQDEDLWPDPKKFDPERFSKGRITPRQNTAFKPFGFAGKRVCPGQHFFYAEVPTFLAILCRAFKFNLVPGQVVESVHGLVTKPKEEIWMTLEKRK